METKYEESKPKYIVKAIEPDELQMKAMEEGSDDPGWVEGYMATFNNIDLVGDKIIPGAFKKTINERVNSKKVSLLVRHMRDGGDFMDEVALVTEAKEDKKGLWFHADFLSNTFAQEVRQRILERKEKGFKTPFSIGYQVIRMEPVQNNNTLIYELKELKLLEGTITLRPANEKALMTSAKTTGVTPSKETGAQEEAPPAETISQEEIDLIELEAKNHGFLIFLEGESRS